MRFGEEKLAEMVAEEARLNQEIQTLATDLLQEYESDEWGGEHGPNKLVKYKAMQERHAQFMRERDSVEAKRVRYEDHAPKNRSPKEWGRQVLQRWAASGTAELDQDEIDLFLQPADKDVLNGISRQLGFAVPSGDLFAPAGPEMAAIDPTRSDVKTASGDSAFGEAVPEVWRSGLVETLRYAGAVASMCQNFSTEDGRPIHVNQLDTSSEEGGSISDQSSAATGVPGAPDQINSITDIEFGASWRHSNFLDVRFETLTDVHFDAAGRVVREMTRRMGRGWNKAFTSGTGSGTGFPQGIVGQAQVVLGGTGSIDAVDYANLLDMEYKIDLAYLEGNEGFEGGFTDGEMGTIGWMMNRNIEKVLRSATDGDDRPLWSPDLESGRAIQGKPGRINAYPYAINNHMATGSTDDDLPLFFGNCGHYGVRNVGGPMFFRFNDSATIARFAVRFFACSRRDGRSLGPHTAAKNEAFAILQVQT